MASDEAGAAAPAGSLGDEARHAKQLKSDEENAEWARFRTRVTAALGDEAFEELVKGRMAHFWVGTTDPDFDKSLLERMPQDGALKPNRARRGLQFRIELGSAYPEEPPRITVLSKNAMSQAVQDSCDQFLAANAGAPLLRPLLRWLDRAIGEWRAPLDQSPRSDAAESGARAEAAAALVPEPDETEMGRGAAEASAAALVEAIGETANSSAVEEAISAPHGADSWKLGEQIALERALIRYPASMGKHKRWRCIAGAVKVRSKRECIERFIYLRRTILQERRPEVPSPAPASKSGASEPAPPSAQDDAVANWTAEEQASLDAALAAHPATLERNERWKRIAADVPGRSKRECAQRFKYLRGKLLERTEETANRSSDEQLEATQEEAEEAAQQQAAEALPNLNPEERGSALSLTSLDLARVGWFYVKRLKAQCSCHGCGTDVVVQAENGIASKHWCSACSTRLEVQLNASLAHGACNGRVGYLDLTNTTVQDVLGCDLALGCFECSSITPTNAFIAPSQTFETSCRTCHARLRVVYKWWQVDPLSHGAGQQGSSRGNNARTRRPVRDPRIVPGKPLPLEGTCTHYKRSHRWLRFPCCGVAYPCDICHEEIGSCEDPRWASRQLCGFCAFEQAYSNDKPCAKCGKTIGAAKPSAHWEGGKGCRNKAFMSSKDSRKFANSNLKTKSRKAERVGPKPR